MSWFPLKLIQYFGSQTFSAWGSVISNDHRIKELRRIHPAGLFSVPPSSWPHGKFCRDTESSGKRPRQLRPQRAKGRWKGSVGGGRGRAAMVLWPPGVPGVNLVWPAGHLQWGVLDRSLPWPSVWPEGSQRFLLLFLTKGSLLSGWPRPPQAQGRLILPPPGSLPCLPHPQWCPCSLKFHT